MKTCATCLFWGRDNLNQTTKNEGEQFRECGAVPQSHDVTDEQRSYTKAVAVDGSGYFAALRSAADFGCVLWVKKRD